MGMYTELIFEGETKDDLSEDVLSVIRYFFNEDSCINDDVSLIPNHPFFECDRWKHIGHLCSFYFIPLSVRKMSSKEWMKSHHVFLRCDLKNYDDEIELFINWIKPYMYSYKAIYQYEEDENPTVIQYKNPDESDE